MVWDRDQNQSANKQNYSFKWKGHVQGECKMCSLVKSRCIWGIVKVCCWLDHQLYSQTGAAKRKTTGCLALMMTLPFPRVMNGWCLWCQYKHPWGLRIKNSTHTGRCWYIRTQPTSIPSENLLLHSSPIQPKPKRGKCCHYFLGEWCPDLATKPQNHSCVCMYVVFGIWWTHFTVN